MVVRGGASGSKRQRWPLGPIRSTATAPLIGVSARSNAYGSVRHAEPGDVAQPLGGLELHTERGRDVAGVDPALGESRRDESVHRKLVGDPRDTPARFRGARTRTRSPATRRHRRRIVSRHPSRIGRDFARPPRRRPTTVWLSRLPISPFGSGSSTPPTLATASSSVSARSQQHRGDVPPVTPGRTLPVVVRAPVHQLAAARRVAPPTRSTDRPPRRLRATSSARLTP